MCGPHEASLLRSLRGGLNWWFGAEFAGALFDRAHDSEEVAAVDLLDVVGGVALFEQGPGEGGKLVVGVEVGGNAGDAVEVGADADVVDAADFDSVVDL